MSNTNKTVSIVIVNYNSESFLISCIDSIQKSNYRFYEIILVNNNSPGDFNNIVKQSKGKGKY